MSGLGSSLGSLSCHLLLLLLHPLLLLLLKDQIREGVLAHCSLARNARREFWLSWAWTCWWKVSKRCSGLSDSGGSPEDRVQVIHHTHWLLSCSAGYGLRLLRSWRPCIINWLSRSSSRRFKWSPCTPLSIFCFRLFTGCSSGSIQFQEIHHIWLLLVLSRLINCSWWCESLLARGRHELTLTTRSGSGLLLLILFIRVFIFLVRWLLLLFLVMMMVVVL